MKSPLLKQHCLTVLLWLSFNGILSFVFKQLWFCLLKQEVYLQAKDQERENKVKICCENKKATKKISCHFSPHKSLFWLYKRNDIARGYPWIRTDGWNKLNNMHKQKF